MSSFVLILERFTDAKLQTAVSPSIFSFSTINTFLPFTLSSAETLFAFLVIPPSTTIKSSSSKVEIVPSTNSSLIL